MCSSESERESENEKKEQENKCDARHSRRIIRSPLRGAACTPRHHKRDFPATATAPPGPRGTAARVHESPPQGQFCHPSTAHEETPSSCSDAVWRAADPQHTLAASRVEALQTECHTEIHSRYLAQRFEHDEDTRELSARDVGRRRRRRQKRKICPKRSWGKYVQAVKKKKRRRRSRVQTEKETTKAAGAGARDKVMEESGALDVAHSRGRTPSTFWVPQSCPREEASPARHAPPLNDPPHRRPPRETLIELPSPLSHPVHGPFPSGSTSTSARICSWFAVVPSRGGWEDVGDGGGEALRNKAGGGEKKGAKREGVWKEPSRMRRLETEGGRGRKKHEREVQTTKAAQKGNTTGSQGGRRCAARRRTTAAQRGLATTRGAGRRAPAHAGGPTGSCTPNQGPPLPRALPPSRQRARAAGIQTACLRSRTSPSREARTLGHRLRAQEWIGGWGGEGCTLERKGGEERKKTRTRQRGADHMAALSVARSAGMSHCWGRCSWEIVNIKHGMREGPESVYISRNPAGPSAPKCSRLIHSLRYSHRSTSESIAPQRIVKYNGTSHSQARHQVVAPRSPVDEVAYTLGMNTVP
ncbi:hypothetical protein B0H13DRAFT_1884213 [Mycena leptocephala]|nr:hypothetical protein B0H13DRAFT_1884213 [Mycena leptocephala]